MICVHQGDVIGSVFTQEGEQTVHECKKNKPFASPIACPGCEQFREKKNLADLITVPPKTFNRPDSIQVGVYTCERKEPTLDQCLDSLLTAGFPKENITIFYDGMAPARNDFAYVSSSFRKLAFPSYATTIFTMLMHSGRTYQTKPANQAYLLCQDDVEFIPMNVYDFLIQEVLYPCPEEKFGFMSLFCSNFYFEKNRNDPTLFPWVQEHPRFVHYQGRWVWSGQAILFSQESAQSFIRSTGKWSAMGWYFDKTSEPGATGLHKIDFVTGQWARTQERSIWQPSASFCQHVGRYSTIFSEKQTCYGTRGAYRVL